MDKRIWFITGISSGLGKALAEAVIESGEFVIGTFRKNEQVAAFNNIHGVYAKAILLDITDYNSMHRQVEMIRQDYGRIDVLVNNAGIGMAGAIEEASMNEIRAVFEANFFGPLKLTQMVLPMMRAKRSGHIVQISSHAGVKAFAGFGVYNASKFALEGFSEALEQEIKPLGIGLTIVEPGPFRTNFAGSSLRLGKVTIADYNDTAGTFRQKLLSAHNNQEGHPQKAAQAIINHINTPNASLRLPLGSIPIKTIGMKINSLQADINANKKIAENTVY